MILICLAKTVLPILSIRNKYCKFKKQLNCITPFSTECRKITIIHGDLLVSFCYSNKANTKEKPFFLFCAHLLRRESDCYCPHSYFFSRYLSKTDPLHQSVYKKKSVRWYIGINALLDLKHRLNLLFCI